MKRIVITMIVVLAMAPLAAWSGYGSSGSNHAQAGFDKLKSLAGTWETTDDLHGGDTKTQITYQIVSNGTAVMETIDTPGEAMITMYHLDGDKIMMTHYCAMGNQPRMRASVPAGDVSELVFKFVDGGNMKKNDLHMHGLNLKFVDDSHVTATWALWDKGKLKDNHVFNLTRKS